MMPSFRERRIYLFDQYAENLAKVKQIVSIEPDMADAVICPLCLRLFGRNALDIPQILTLDHVPPKSLGGADSQAVLLCGECNHVAGQTLDANAKKYLDARDFARGLPGSSIDGLVSVGKNPHMPATLSYGSEGQLHIYRDPKRMNPKHGKQEHEYLDSLVGQSDIKLTGNIRFKGAQARLTKVAWLRYAYLIFFRWFGYSGILTASFDKVRQQILNPRAEILPDAWLTRHRNLEDLPSAVHAIRSPAKLQSFLVVYTVATERSVLKITTIIPNLDPASLSVYDSLKLEGDETLEGTQLVQLDSYWSDPVLCLRTLRGVFSHG